MVVYFHFYLVRLCTIFVKNIWQGVNSDVNFTYFEHIQDFRGSGKRENSLVMRQTSEFQNGGSKKTKYTKFSKKQTLLTP